MFEDLQREINVCFESGLNEDMYMYADNKLKPLNFHDASKIAAFLLQTSENFKPP